MNILGKDYLLVTLDFETHFAPKYSLTTMNTFEYVDHELFSIHGVGIKIENGPNLWFRHTEDALAYIDDNNPDELPVALLCQNTYFDGWIMHRKFDWHADLYLDTMCMSRGMFPTQSAGLAALAERLWPDNPAMRKGKELIQFKGVTTEHLWSNKALEDTMVRYCIGDNKKDQGDVGLTYMAFCRMLPFYPDDELRLIDLTLQMMCKPLLHINVPRVIECRDNAIAKRNALIKASGLSETLLSSNAQFERWLIANNIPVPLKPSPTQKVKDEAGNEVPVMIPALGKSDLGFQEMRKLYPEHEPVWAGRIAAKSVGEITRAERFIATAEQCDGFMPVALAYYSARTGRYGGCLTADTVVSVYNAHSGPEDKSITDVQDDDLVWDGEEYVHHDGVVFSGVKEVITYGGITGTPDHIVFTACGAEKPLAQARADGDSLKVCPSPKGHLLGLAGADARTRDENESASGLSLWENEGSTGIGCTSRGEQELSQLRAVSEDGRGAADARTAGYASCDDGESRAGQLGAPLSPLSITGSGAISLESPARADDSSQAAVQQWTPQLRGSRNSLPVRQSEPSSGMGDTTLGTANPGAEHRQGRQQLPLHAGQPALGRSNNPVEQPPDVRAESDRAAHQALKDAAPGLQLRVDPHVREPGDDRRADHDEGQVPTYDILNCGPRHRFVANGKLVHNSEKLNLQNLGRGSELRKSLCAPDGQLVYVADSSNIEARMLAWMAEHETLIDQFRNKEDVYSNFASTIYNKPINKHEHPVERFIGKTCLAEGTLVLTNEGWTPIEKVTTAQRVWDGEEWVCHQGVIYNGFKPTLTLCGLSLTPDHLVWSGTTWLEARSLQDDAATLSLSLAHAAERLPSPDTYVGKKAASTRSLFDAIAASLSTRSKATTSATLSLPAAMSVLRQRQAKNGTGSIQTPCRMTSIAHVCLTAWQRLSHAVGRLLAGYTGTMGVEASVSTGSGLTTALRPFGMSRPFPTGTSRNTKWTGATTTATTNRATSVLYHAATTPKTSEKSATSKKKLHVFDVTCAGPRNRFTVLTANGPLIVHNCVLGLGYQVGWRKLRSSLATSAEAVILDEVEAQRIVTLYRTINAPIKNYWAQAENAIADMYLGNTRQWGALTVHKNCLVMPNGMALQYPGLRPVAPSEDGTTSGGWEYWEGKFWTNLYGGKLTENICQALSRIVLFDQMLAINSLFEPHGGRVVMNVHDEIIAVGPNLGKDNENPLFRQMIEIMRTPPGWCADLPLDGEGGTAVEYSK